MAAEAAAATTDLVARTEVRRQESSSALDPKERAKRGQYFTPAPAADFIASLARLDHTGPIRILDPGAGAGSLTASLVSRILQEQPEAQLSVTACENDPQLHATLLATLEDCASTARASGGRVETTLVTDDFIAWTTQAEGLFGEDRGPFDLVVMNPPYKKLAANSRERMAVTAACTETSNLYSAFLALGIHLLAPGGQLVAITPRSFANGPYFRPFRKYLLDRIHIDRIHLFEARNKVFADTDVLQENVIFSATRTDAPDRGPIVVSSSHSYGGEIRSRVMEYREMVQPEDSEHFIHISADEEDAQLAATHAGLAENLAGIECQVSTGRVVDFRSKEHLRPDPEEGTVPLIYPLHMRDGGIRWPVPGAKKNNAIMLNSDTEKMTFPSGYYVVVKRLSSKEEKRRVVATVFDPDVTPCARIGFENHVNVFHSAGAGLPKEVARGLCLWLNSTLLDRLIRRFSGHTQVNATDLRNLRYPSNAQLRAIGSEWIEGGWPDQEKLDDLVERHLEPTEPASLSEV
ncbi:SAM-dependent DNA methyltransferase [Streptomyces klenkii]|uniref:site-specific DNA-methyltransferase (adenine-specific) n=1 Tax=Streptomyces klenkii TaxID=1420899 RepID=A0A3B0BQ73_9ACTN|nr:N-6 DNA methylase [Streptomyces klenkii]RKN74584.1 SAM-dependent DNA methyltransferase [Streptomyces klenkii]